MPHALALLAGAVVGHVVRRAAPWLARVKSEGIPFRWPWLEFVSALAFLGVVVRAPDPPGFLLAALLVAITATDFHVKLIPDRVTISGAALGLVASGIWPARILAAPGHARVLEALGLPGGAAGGIVLALLGAVAGFTLLEGFRRGVGAVVGMEVLGMGDSKLLLMAGAFLGPAAILVSLVPALAAGIVLGVPYTRIAKTPHLPFGPALALGAYLTSLFARAILDAWLGIGKAARALPPRVAGLLSLAMIAIAVWLLVRVRRRRAEYTRMIEEDYERIEERD